MREQSSFALAASYLVGLKVQVRLHRNYMYDLASFVVKIKIVDGQMNE